MRIPHVYTSGVVTASFTPAGKDSRIAFSRDGRKTWKTLWEGRAKEARVALRQQIVGMRDVSFRFEGPVETFKIDKVFQHNMYARPYLAPGKNEITVHASDTALLREAPLRIVWAWNEEGEDRAHVREVKTLPVTYSVDVGGTDLPRMRSLELSVP